MTETGTAMFQPANRPAVPEAAPACVMRTAQIVSPVAEPRYLAVLLAHASVAGLERTACSI